MVNREDGPEFACRLLAFTESRSTAKVGRDTYGELAKPVPDRRHP